MGLQYSVACGLDEETAARLQVYDCYARGKEFDASSASGAGGGGGGEAEAIGAASPRDHSSNTGHTGHVATTTPTATGTTSGDSGGGGGGGGGSGVGTTNDVERGITFHRRRGSSRGSIGSDRSDNTDNNDDNMLSPQRLRKKRLSWSAKDKGMLQGLDTDDNDNNNSRRNNNSTSSTGSKDDHDDDELSFSPSRARRGSASGKHARRRSKRGSRDRISFGFSQSPPQSSALDEQKAKNPASPAAAQPSASVDVETKGVARMHTVNEFLSTRKRSSLGDVFAGPVALDGDSSDDADPNTHKRHISKSVRRSRPRHASVRSIHDVSSDDNDDDDDDDDADADDATLITDVEETPEERQARLKRKVVAEVLSTEVSYVDSLEALQELYLTPLAADVEVAETPMLTQDEISLVFSNIRVILQLNQRFLKDLRDRVAVPTAKGVELGQLFLQYAPYFKMYATYVENHEKSSRFLQSLPYQGKKYERFLQFCQEAEASPRSRSNTLSSFLIMPIQRVPRYNLLLRELIKRSEPDSADYKELQDALDLMQRTATEVNKSIRIREENQKVFAIQELFLGKVSFIAPGRKLVHTGQVWKVGKAKDEKIWLFLFSDLLVVSDRTLLPVGWRYSLLHQLPINEYFHVEDVADDEASELIEQSMKDEKELEAKTISAQSVGPELSVTQVAKSGRRTNSFIIATHESSFVVYTDNEKRKEEWMSVLSTQVARQRKAIRRRSLDGRLVKLAPLEVQYQPNMPCHVCGLAITRLQRHTNCTRCGRVTHTKCADNKRVLPGFHTKDLQTVCDTCADDIHRQKLEELGYGGRKNTPQEDSVSSVERARSRSASRPPQPPRRPSRDKVDQAMKDKALSPVLNLNAKKPLTYAAVASSTPCPATTTTATSTTNNTAVTDAGPVAAPEQSDSQPGAPPKPVDSNENTAVTSAAVDGPEYVHHTADQSPAAAAVGNADDNTTILVLTDEEDDDDNDDVVAQRIQKEQEILAQPAVGGGDDAPVDDQGTGLASPAQPEDEKEKKNESEVSPATQSPTGAAPPLPTRPPPVVPAHVRRRSSVKGDKPPPLPSRPAPRVPDHIRRASQEALASSVVTQEEEQDKLDSGSQPVDAASEEDKEAPSDPSAATPAADVAAEDSAPAADKEKEEEEEKKSKQQELRLSVGAHCEAKWTDGHWYPAEVTQVHSEHGTYTVMYTEYHETAEVGVEDIRAASSNPTKTSDSAQTNNDSHHTEPQALIDDKQPDDDDSTPAFTPSDQQSVSNPGLSDAKQSAEQGDAHDVQEEKVVADVDQSDVGPASSSPTHADNGPVRRDSSNVSIPAPTYPSVVPAPPPPPAGAKDDDDDDDDVDDDIQDVPEPAAQGNGVAQDDAVDEEEEEEKEEEEVANQGMVDRVEDVEASADMDVVAKEQSEEQPQQANSADVDEVDTANALKDSEYNNKQEEDKAPPRKVSIPPVLPPRPAQTHVKDLIRRSSQDKLTSPVPAVPPRSPRRHSTDSV